MVKNACNHLFSKMYCIFTLQVDRGGFMAKYIFRPRSRGLSLLPGSARERGKGPWERVCIVSSRMWFHIYHSGEVLWMLDIFGQGCVTGISAVSTFTVTISITWRPNRKSKYESKPTKCKGPRTKCCWWTQDLWKTWSANKWKTWNVELQGWCNCVENLMRQRHKVFIKSTTTCSLPAKAD